MRGKHRDFGPLDKSHDPVNAGCGVADHDTVCAQPKTPERMTTTSIIVWLLLWSAGFALAARMFRGRAAEPASDAGRLSIVIPARNEEHNLPALLESIAAEELRPREVIVVDDGSSDNTAGIARSHGARVVESAPLPDGWRGKTWACHQGAGVAEGELLLFMDADTWFEPGGLARVLGMYFRGEEQEGSRRLSPREMEVRRPSLPGALSVVPYHEVRRPYEDLSLFFNLCMTAGTVPNALSGQFLLVSRQDLQRAGGHESVRGRVLENFRLAENFRAAGVAVRGVSGRGMVGFRMYPDGFASLVEGWTKGFAAGAGRTPPQVLALVVAWMSGLMLPPLLGTLAGSWPMGLAAWLLCVVQLLYVARRLGSFGWPGILLYPLPLFFFFAVFAWSAMRSGKKVTWKGREIHAD